MEFTDPYDLERCDRCGVTTAWYDDTGKVETQQCRCKPCVRCKEPADLGPLGLCADCAEPENVNCERCGKFATSAHFIQDADDQSQGITLCDDCADPGGAIDRAGLMSDR